MNFTDKTPPVAPQPDTTPATASGPPETATEPKEDKKAEGAEARASNTLGVILKPVLTRIEQWFNDKTARTQIIIGASVIALVALGVIAYHFSGTESGKKDKQNNIDIRNGNGPINIINTNTVDFGRLWPGLLEELRIQAKGLGTTRVPYKLPEENLGELEKFLNQQRNVPSEKLTDQDKASCLYAAAVLSLNGRQVPDLNRWLDPGMIDSVEQGVTDKIKPAKDAVSSALNQVVPILVAADWAFANRKVDRAIDLYERYIRLLRSIPAPLADELPATDERKQVILRAEEKLGIAYLDRAADLIRGNKPGDKEAGEQLRGKAHDLYSHIATDRKGAQITIVPDEKNRPAEWYIHSKVGRAGVSVVRDADRYAIRMTNNNSSFLAAQLIEVNRPSDYRLKWRWRLTKTAPGFRDRQTRLSLNHPLSVTAAFLTKSNSIIAIHYVIDPLDPVGKRWMDKEEGIIKKGVFEYPLWYPHVVVADNKMPLGEWRSYEVDPAADYQAFAKKYPQELGTGGVPPLRGIVVGSNCQFAEVGGPTNSVEGEVADIRLEPIPRPERPALDSKEWKKHPSGLETWEVKEGNGEAVKPGATVVVQYTGWLADSTATRIDSTADLGGRAVLSLNDQIKGWQEGISGMKPGGIRRFKIPAELAHGPRGKGSVPGDATLVYEMELIEVK